MCIYINFITMLHSSRESYFRVLISSKNQWNNMAATFLTLASIIISNWTGNDTLKPLVCTCSHPKISAAAGAVSWTLNKHNMTSMKLLHSINCCIVCLTAPKHIPSQNSWQGWQVLVEILLYLQRKQKDVILSLKKKKGELSDKMWI